MKIKSQERIAMLMSQRPKNKRQILKIVKEKYI